jgi:hypothetical protein
MSDAPPFVESCAWQKHERPDEQENIGDRPALAGKGRQAGPRIQEAANARDDVDWITLRSSAHARGLPLLPGNSFKLGPLKAGGRKICVISVRLTRTIRPLGRKPASL